MEADPVPKGLDGYNDIGDELIARQGFKVDREGLDGRPAELPQEPAPELEEDPQRLGDREDDLAMRDIQEERLPHPRRPGPRALPGGQLPPYSPVNMHILAHSGQ